MSRIYEEDLIPIKEEFPDIKDLEAKILYLRRDGHNYTQIQKWLGNPSKKKIREVLLKWEPNLIDMDCNYNKLNKQY